MRIDHIEAAHLRFEYPPDRAFHYAGGTCTARLTSLVFIHTDTKHVGVGAAYSHPAMVDLVVRHQLDPLLRGEDATDIDALWNKMYGLTRWYGRKGAAMTAIGAIDTALWDLRGKAADKPVWKLLGGNRRTCPAYGSALLWKPVEQLAEEAGRLVNAGFRRVKLRMARSEEYDTSAVRAVRKAIGRDNDLLVDASMRYDVELARRVGRVLEENHVFWYEEPFTPEDIDSYVKLRGTVKAPLAAGENEFGVQGFRELIRAGAVDIVQPDASRCGGISEMWRVGQMAHDNGLKVASHTWSDAVAVLANAHAISAMPNGVTVEIDKTGNPFIEQLLLDPLTVRDGQLQLSDAPGLGAQVDPDVIRRLKLADPLDIPDGNYSDMVFGKSFATPAGPYVRSS